MILNSSYSKQWKSQLLLAIVFLTLNTIGFSQNSTPNGTEVLGTPKPFSEVQKRHQNQIVFSNQEISFMKEDESQFKTEFDLGDPIYLRVYHDETLEKKGNAFLKETKKMEFLDNNKYCFGTVVKINGEEIYSETFQQHNTITMTFTAGGGHIFSTKEKNLAYGSVAVSIRNAFSTMREDFIPGKYEIEIDQYAILSILPGMKVKMDQRTHKMCSGKITINATAEGIKKYAPLLCSNIATKHPDSMHDPKLESDVIKLYNRTFKKTTAKAAMIRGFDWEIRRNAFGAITERYILTRVLYVMDDGRTGSLEFQIKQLYDGSNYGGAKYDASFDDDPMCPQCIDYYIENYTK